MRVPFANWRGDIPNRTAGNETGAMGLVLHKQQGTEAGTDSWFKNPAAKASAHFGASKAGTLDQWVDTHDEAWAEAAGNPRWLSLELEGFAGEPMTPPQLAITAKLYGWGSANLRWPAVVTDNVNVAGLGWHGMGGAAWGGHYDCPGDPVKRQRPTVLALAFPVGSPIATEEVSMAMPRTVPDLKAPPDASGRTPNWEVDAAGDVFCWDGARQLKSLGKLTASHPPIADIAPHPSGDGVIMYGADGRFENGEWARSSYAVLVGM